MKNKINIFDELVPEKGNVIAEFACGHEGNLEKFKQLVDSVSNSGTKIIKSQIFIPIERVSKNHPEWKLFNDVCLSESDWMEASKYIKSKGLIFFSDIFGEEGLKIAESVGVDGYKIHSEDLLNTKFIEKVAALNKTLLIGVGGAHRKEILKLLEHLSSKQLLKKTILMPGVQTFPTPLNTHSIFEIKDLIEKYQKKFGVKVGCADHVSGDLEEAMDFPLVAIGSGACLIEKHVTVDRSLKWEDYQSALNANDFTQLVKKVSCFAALLKTQGKQNKDEITYRHAFKKTAVATRDIEAEKTIKEEDIKYIKLEKIKVPMSAIDLIGKKTVKKIKKDEVFREKMFKQKIGIIIVARNSSNRLPNKATKKILGIETIALLIQRIKRCKNADSVILATSNLKEDDVIEEIGKREGILTFRGDLKNVSKRFYQAAKFYELSHIVRVTGDDILRDEIIIDKAIQSHLEESCDVTITANMPYGTQTEIFSFNTIKTIMELANKIDNTEYLEWFLQNDRYFSVNYIQCPYKYDKNLRITLDYEEDLIFFTKIFEHFYSSKKYFSLEEVLKWLHENPNIAKINMHKNPKYLTKLNEHGTYVSKEIDVSLNI